MSTPATYLNAGLILIASTFLSACGGGGGGGGGGDTVASNPVTISAANAPQVSGAAFNTTAGLEGGGTGATGALPLVGAVTQTSGSSIDVVDVLASQIQMIQPFLASSAATSVTGVVISQSIPCDSGSLDFTFNDADNNGDLSSGDTVTMSASNCVQGSTTITGSITIDNVIVSGDPMSFPYTLQFRIQASGFTISESGELVALNGSMTLNQTTSDGISFSNTISGSSIQVNEGGTAATLGNYSISGSEDGATGAYTLNMNATVTSSDLGGSVTIVTDITFQGVGADNPMTGQATITGANNSRVTLIALDAVNVRLEVDADGNGAVETTIDTTWDSL